MQIKLLNHPTSNDWREVKRRALLTVGLRAITPPTLQWKHDILEARHSPIRYLRFSYEITGIPYWVAMHLRTHVHDCPNGDEFLPYIRSQRNDRQDDYDRGAARQDQPVNMILDLSGEQLMNLANKRLCGCTAIETRAAVREMCDLAVDACPEFDGLLVPQCKHDGGVCHEMKSCGLSPAAPEVSGHV